MKRPHPNTIASCALAAALSSVLIGLGAPGALGFGTTGTQGNAAAGKSVFNTTCAACHTLKAAGSLGTIGPNLDDVTLSEATIAAAVNNGGLR